MKLPFPRDQASVFFLLSLYGGGGVCGAISSSNDQFNSWIKIYGMAHFYAVSRLNPLKSAKGPEERRKTMILATESVLIMLSNIFPILTHYKFYYVIPGFFILIKSFIYIRGLPTSALFQARESKNSAMKIRPWFFRIDYFENNRQILSSHLELVILENSWFFASYLSKYKQKSD